MYEDFTERARAVIQLANRAAGEWCHEYLGTEHVLLGLIRERSNVAAHVLADLNLAEIVETRLCNEVVKGPDIVTMGRLPTTPRLKLAIDKARSWTVKLKHRYVGPEHLLLGLIDDPDNLISAIIATSGVSTETVRKRCLEFVGQAPLSEDPPVKRGGLRIASITPCLLALAEGKWVRVLNDQLEIRDDTDADRLTRVLQGIRERAAVFARTDAGDRPRKSAVSACTWIVSEIDGLLPKPPSESSC